MALNQPMPGMVCVIVKVFLYRSFVHRERKALCRTVPVGPEQIQLVRIVRLNLRESLSVQVP